MDIKGWCGGDTATPVNSKHIRGGSPKLRTRR